MIYQSDANEQTRAMMLSGPDAKCDSLKLCKLTSICADETLPAPLIINFWQGNPDRSEARVPKRHATQISAADHELGMLNSRPGSTPSFACPILLAQVSLLSWS